MIPKLGCFVYSRSVRTVAQEIGWDRGRPRPQMSAKREKNISKHSAPDGALRARAPAVPANLLSYDFTAVAIVSGHDHNRPFASGLKRF